MKLYDDFVELEPNALKALEAELRNTNNSLNEQGSPRHWKFARGFADLPSFIERKVRSICTWNRDDYSLPINSPPGRTEVPDPPDSGVLHLLLCFHSSELGVKLHQERLSLINTDKELIVYLKEIYYQRRNVLSWLTLRNISKVILGRVGCTTCFYPADS